MYACLVKKKNDFRDDLSGVCTSGSIMSAQPLVWESQEQVSGESTSDIDDRTQPPANMSNAPLSPSLLAGGDNSLDNNSLGRASSLLPLSAGTLDDPVTVDDSGYAGEVNGSSNLQKTLENDPKVPKLETSSYEDVVKSLEAEGLHAAAMAEAAEAKVALAKAQADLLKTAASNPGLGRRIQVNKLRHNLSELGWIERINEEHVPISDEDFDFSFFSVENLDFKADYVKGKPFLLSEERIDNSLRMLKREGGVNLKGCQVNLQRLDPEVQEKEISPPKKKRRKRKVKISPRYVDLSTSELTDSDDKQPEMANKLWQHFFLSEDRRRALIVDLPYNSPGGSVVFSDEISVKAKQTRTAFVEEVKKTLEVSGRQDATKQLLGIFCDNPEAFFNTMRLVRTLSKAGYSDPGIISSMIEYDETLQKAVIVDPGEADSGKIVPAEVSSLLQSDYAKGGVSDSALITTIHSLLSSSDAPAFSSTPQPFDLKSLYYCQYISAVYNCMDTTSDL